MADRWRRLVWALTVVMLLAIAVDIGLFISNLSVPATGGTVQEDLRIMLPLIVVALGLVGAVIVTQVPGSAVGWICWALAWEGTIQVLMAEYAYTAERVGPLPGATAAGQLSQQLGQPLSLLALVNILFAFPDSRLPSKRWRPVAILSNVLLLLATAASVTSSKVAGQLAEGAVLFAVLLALSALIVKYRRFDRVRRQQVKWLAYAAVIVSLCQLLAATITVSGHAAFVSHAGFVNYAAAAIIIGSFILLPISMAIAILRYRLYDIDLVINRTLAYGALAVVITLLYVVIVLGIGELIGAGSRSNLLLSLLATALVAVLFQPLRQRAQRLANRLVYGTRATPYEVLSSFSERLGQTVASEETLRQMAAVLADGTAASRAQVWLRSGSSLQLAAQHPATGVSQPLLRVVGDELPAIPGADVAVPVRYQGELLGALAVEKRKGDSLLPVEEKLMADLASQAGLALKNVGLAADLRQRLEELRASRARLVTAQDAERRRLERNIHDGAQQNLVALKIKLGLARRLAIKDPVRVPEVIDQLIADADETLNTLRDLARGIYPPLLADQGLRAALQAQANRSPIPAVVDTNGSARYRPDVEAAVYFCCLEALQNAAKYSNATQLRISLRDDDDGNLAFAVVDNGRGYDTELVKPGSGLSNMRDRLEALGGKLSMWSSLGAGTRVEGLLPVKPT